MKTICNIAKNIYPTNIEKHTQNMETFDGWLRYWDKVIIIASSVDNKMHISTHGSIIAYLIPSHPNKLVNYFVFLLRAFLIVVKERKQITLIDGSEPTSGGVVAFFTKLILRIPYILEFQGQYFSLTVKEIGLLRRVVMKPLLLPICFLASGIRCVSDNVRSDLEQYQFMKAKLYTVPARCNTKIFTPEKYIQARTDIRKKLQIDEDEPVLLFVGRLVIFKGLKYLINAFPQLVSQIPKVKLVIIGDGPLNNELQEQTNRLDMGNHILFLGRVDFSEIPAYLSIAEVFTLPSTDEGMGRVVLEAMAMKIPVTCSAVGGLLDIIEHKRNGIFFESRNEKDMAEKLALILKDNDLKRTITENAFKEVKEKYDYEVSISLFNKMFKEIVESKNG